VKAFEFPHLYIAEKIVIGLPLDENGIIVGLFRNYTTTRRTDRHYHTSLHTEQSWRAVKVSHSRLHYCNRQFVLLDCFVLLQKCCSSRLVRVPFMW